MTKPERIEKIAARFRLGRELRRGRRRRGKLPANLSGRHSESDSNGSRRIPPKKFVYTSSTSVYAQNDGSQVKESSPTEPAAETSKILVETEKVLLDAVAQKKFPAVILRVAGIYGPERGHWFRQFLKDEAHIEGDGSRFLNMIHRDDLIGCIIAALKNGRAGEIYNAVDDEPVSQLHFFQWLAQAVGQTAAAVRAGKFRRKSANAARPTSASPTAN